MDSEEAAQLAIAALDGVILPGSSKKLCVTKFVKKSDRQALPEGPRGGTNLYIKNLDWDVTDDVLRQRFSAYGNISSAVVMKDRDGKSRGFGFVDFESPEAAKNALENLNGSDLGSKSLYVGYAQKRSERDRLLRLRFAGRHEHKFTKIQGSTVYVKNLEKSVDTATLRRLFSECGFVLWTKVIYDKNGLSRGFGFVCFSSAEEANEAVHRFNGNMFCGRRLYVTIAQNKEDRRKYLQLQLANSKFVPVQHAISHNGFPAPYNVPNYEWFQNQVPMNPVYLYQPNGMVHFLGTQASSSNAPTIPHQWRQLGHRSSSSVNRLTQPVQTSNTSDFNQFLYPVHKMYPPPTHNIWRYIPTHSYACSLGGSLKHNPMLIYLLLQMNRNGHYGNVNDGSYSSWGAWKTLYQRQTCSIEPIVVDVDIRQ
ncbi:Polyadenylate-binding protein [Musa troglodytarum]|uniref:Polyadenylate-binding protein n=1 Tax=Musa troglodytarum TaxID=320322 RepID=A0A9E7FJS5_9LILI|nr:Polyadenylate-binding protein [Musa troglodytarum]